MKRVLNWMMRLICLLAVSGIATAQEEAQEKETLVLLDTDMGKIKVKLFNETPLHRDNFVKNVNEKVYDGTLFHRIIKQFMVQGGDLNSKNASKELVLGEDSLNYTIPAEIVFPQYFHKKGMLCAARTGDEENPEKASSPVQFYIVTGKHFTEMELDKMETNTGKIFTPEMREAYMMEGGTPHLDGNYTIFGEVVSGIKVVDKMQFVTTDTNDRPIKNIRIKSAKIVTK